MQTGTPPRTTAKLFWNGKSQAVRLPKAFRFDDGEVIIRKQGNEVILSPKPKNGKTARSEWDALFAALPALDDDFMRERPLNVVPPAEDIF